MNKLLLSASILAAATAAYHAIAGSSEVVAPLLMSSLDEDVRLTLYAAWHCATVTFFLSALAFFLGSFPRRAVGSLSMVRFVSALWLAFGAVFLLIAVTQPGTGLLLKLPQWMLLIPVGVLGWLGGESNRRAEQSSLE